MWFRLFHIVLQWSQLSKVTKHAFLVLINDSSRIVYLLVDRKVELVILKNKCFYVTDYVLFRLRAWSLATVYAISLFRTGTSYLLLLVSQTVVTSLYDYRYRSVLL